MYTNDPVSITMYTNVYINIVAKRSPNSLRPSFKRWHIDYFQAFILFQFTRSWVSPWVCSFKIKVIPCQFSKRRLATCERFHYTSEWTHHKRPAEGPLLIYSHWCWQPCCWLCSLPLGRQRSLIIWPFFNWMLNDFVDTDVELLIKVTLWLRKPV